MKHVLLAALTAFLVLVSGCDKLKLPSSNGSSDADAELNSNFKKGKEKYGLMDYKGSIQAYEAALRDNPQMAKAHLEIALIYDDKYQDHIGAIYHFRKYLELRPDSGKKEMIDEFIANSTKQMLAKESVMLSQDKGEIMRLRAENNTLRNQIAQLTGKAPAPAGPPTVTLPRSASASQPAPGVPQAGNQTYVVVPGDTLSKISQKFYKSKNQWHRILEANPELKDPKNLKPGQTLVIP